MMIHTDSFTLTKDDCISYIESHGQSLPDDVDVVWMENGVEKSVVPLEAVHIVVRIKQPDQSIFHISAYTPARSKKF